MQDRLQGAPNEAASSNKDTMNVPLVVGTKPCAGQQDPGGVLVGCAGLSWLQ